MGTLLSVPFHEIWRPIKLSERSHMLATITRPQKLFKNLNFIQDRVREPVCLYICVNLTLNKTASCQDSTSMYPPPPPPSSSVPLPVLLCLLSCLPSIPEHRVASISGPYIPGFSGLKPHFLSVFANISCSQ